MRLGVRIAYTSGTDPNNFLAIDTLNRKGDTFIFVNLHTSEMAGSTHPSQAARVTLKFHEPHAPLENQEKRLARAVRNVFYVFLRDFQTSKGGYCFKVIMRAFGLMALEEITALNRNKGNPEVIKDLVEEGVGVTKFVALGLMIDYTKWLCSHALACQPSNTASKPNSAWFLPKTIAKTTDKTLKIAGLIVFVCTINELVRPLESSNIEKLRLHRISTYAIALYFGLQISLKLFAHPAIKSSLNNLKTNRSPATERRTS